MHRLFFMVLRLGGEARPDSDVDLLILLDKNEITPEEEEEITAPLYDMEFEQGIIISPIVMTRKRWEEAKKQTLFYYNVLKDGILLQWMKTYARIC